MKFSTLFLSALLALGSASAFAKDMCGSRTDAQVSARSTTQFQTEVRDLEERADNLADYGDDDFRPVQQKAHELSQLNTNLQRLFLGSQPICTQAVSRLLQRIENRENELQQAVRTTYDHPRFDITHRAGRVAGSLEQLKLSVQSLISYLDVYGRPNTDD